jgi:eukaryotic-like serine/threonine-protein kinase
MEQHIFKRNLNTDRSTSLSIIDLSSFELTRIQGDYGHPRVLLRDAGHFNYVGRKLCEDESLEPKRVTMVKKRWTLPTGVMIEARYRLVREIGVGGMGAVYEAVDVKLERPVALKFLDPALVTDEEHVARFHREALAAGRIGHPNICDVRDRGITEDGAHFIVMELLSGRTFFELIQSEGPLPAQRVVPIVLKVLSALAAAHRVGIVHRDLKPENIFICTASTGDEQIKLLDFGVSRFLDDSNALRLTKSGKVLGTPLYVSPEQALAKKDIDHRSDLWGVGVLLYESLTGRPPFRGKNTGQMLVKIIKQEPIPPREYIPWLSQPIEDVILKVLRKKRAERYQNADNFARDLEKALQQSFP